MRLNSFAARFALLILAAASPALAQFGNAISYQAQLRNNGEPVTTESDFQFSLWTADTGGGAMVGSVVEKTGIPGTDGLFRTDADFGINPYATSQELWLQVAVRNPTITGTWVTMTPRQKLTASPYSLSTRGLEMNGSNQGRIWSGIGAAPAFQGRLTLADNSTRTLTITGTVNNTNPTEVFFDKAVAGATHRAALGYATDRGMFHWVNGVDRMNISTGGNIGMGTISNAGRLSVKAISNGWDDGLNLLPSNSDSNRWNLLVDSGSSNSLRLRYAPTGVEALNVTTAGNLTLTRDMIISAPYAGIQLAGSTNDTAVAQIHFNRSAAGAQHQSAVGYSTDRGHYVWVNGADRMSIGTNGKVGINQAPDGFYQLSVAGWMRATDTVRADNEIIAGNRVLSYGNLSVVGFTNLDGGTFIGGKFNIGSTGPENVRASIYPVGLQWAQYTFGDAGGFNGWNVLSDRRLKKNVETLCHPLDLVRALRGVSFDWRQEEFPEHGNAEGRQIGFIAQEVQAVVPEAVKDAPGGRLGVTYDTIVPILVEAVKEQDQEIAALRAKVEALTNGNQELTSRLERIEAYLEARAAAENKAPDSALAAAGAR